MKNLIPLLLLMLVGCQAAPAPVTAPPPLPVAAPAIAVPASPPPDVILERKARLQAQYIEALISQNEALSARLNPAPESAPYPSPLARALTKPFAPPSAPTENASAPKPAEPPTLTPNAEGMIDLAAALVAAKPDEPVNPFTVRSVSPEAVREVSLQVGGIVAGPITCAVINDRLVQVGDMIETLAVERIESDAVIFRHGPQRLRLPVGGKTSRVRLPL